MRLESEVFGSDLGARLIVHAFNQAAKWCDGVISGQHRLYTEIFFLALILTLRPSFPLPAWCRALPDWVEVFSLHPDQLTLLFEAANANQVGLNDWSSSISAAHRLSDFCAGRSAIDLSICAFGDIKASHTLPMFCVLEDKIPNLYSAVQSWMNSSYPIEYENDAFQGFIALTTGQQRRLFVFFHFLMDLAKEDDKSKIWCVEKKLSSSIVSSPMVNNKNYMVAVDALLDLQDKFVFDATS